MSKKNETKKSENVTRKALAKMISERVAEVSQRKAGEVVAALCDSVIESLARGQRVVLGDLGILSLKRTKAREGRNPRTGDTIRIPAKNRVAFRASLRAKKAVLK